MPDSPADAWSGDRVSRWLRQAPALERQMAPISEVLFAAAAIQPGEAVLDVGCGTGATTRDAARLVGHAGHVTGLDIASEMLAAAASVRQPEASAPIDWVEADAVTWASSARYDLLLSRFGVMFFSDQRAAWRHLADAVRQGGRLAMAVWGRRTHSPLFELPYRVALETRQACGDDVEPLSADDGAYSWHDRDAVTALLSEAGFHDVDVAPHPLQLPYLGGVGPARAAQGALDFGPTRTILEGASESTLAAARAALEALFAEHLNAAGEVVLDAQVQIVTASR